MRVLDVFPSRFFDILLEKQDAFNVLNEILRKKEELKTISAVSQKQSVENYITDYDNPVELETFRIVISKIEEMFKQYNLSFNLSSYWTSIYTGSGFHTLHHHQMKRVSDSNYSGILYLSDIGSTEFFSCSPSSYDNYLCIPSEFGKVVMFPSIIPHTYSPTHNDNNIRYVVPFNFELREINGCV